MPTYECSPTAIAVAILAETPSSESRSAIYLHFDHSPTHSSHPSIHRGRNNEISRSDPSIDWTHLIPIWSNVLFWSNFHAKGFSNCCIQLGAWVTQPGAFFFLQLLQSAVCFPTQYFALRIEGRGNNIWRYESADRFPLFNCRYINDCVIGMMAKASEAD